MILLDTDILTHAIAGRSPIIERMQTAAEVPAITIVSRIEVLRGRFDFLLKAANRDELLLAQLWLDTSEGDLAKYHTVPFDNAAATEFDRLRKNKKLKKVGRADLLIASIAVANDATLVTRNLRDFRQVPDLKLENWAD